MSRSLMQADDEARAERLSLSAQMQGRAADHLALAVGRTLDVPCPLFLAEGDGAYVTDVDGNRYLDMIMGFGPHILGHRPAVVEEAVRRQLARGWHFGLTNDAQAEHARLLVEANGGSGKVLYCGSGSEAVMYALRLARAYTGRPRVAVFDGSYHGSVDYVLLAADPASPLDRPDLSVIGAGVPGTVAQDTMLMLPYRSSAAIDLIDRNAADLAAVLIQPVQNSLPRLDNEAFLSALRSACDRHGILLIADEVVTGFRLAYGGGQEAYGFRADLAAFGKAIGGGMPVGALWGRDDVMGLLRQPTAAGGVFSSGTFNANPLTMAAGIAMLGHLEANRASVYPALAAAGDEVAARVNRFAEERQISARLMTAGSMLCLHFTREFPDSMRKLPRANPEATRAFFLEMLDRGVIMPAGRMVLLSTAHGSSEIETLSEAVCATLGRLQERRLV